MSFCGCCTADESKEVILGIKTETPGTENCPSGGKVEVAPPAPPAEKVEEAKETLEPAPVAPPVAPPAPVVQEAPKAAPKEEPPAAAAYTPPPAPAAPAAPAPAPQETVPAPAWRSWTAVVNKGAGQSLGLDVDYADTIMLKVVKVKEGIVKDWNDKNPANIIKKDDKIVSVNGVSGSTSKILEQVKVEGELKLVIERASEYEVTIVKDSPEQSIGLDVDANLVKVLKVKAGPVSSFNAKLSADQQAFVVKPGDKIIKVNGISGSSEIVQELKTNKTLNIRVLRVE